MSNRRSTVAAVLAGLSLASGLPLLSGCWRVERGLELVSYKNPSYPDRQRLKFQQCAYWVDSGHDLRVVAHAEAPGGGAEGTLSRYLYVQLYWRPYPGRTPADSTTSDAMVRYLVASSRGVAVYSGTGFAYPKETMDGGLKLQLESARLHLDYVIGDPPTLSDAHLAGPLEAKQDATTAVRLLREMELCEGK